MQFIAALFGGPDNTILNAAFALGFVLVLVVLGLWVLKVFTNASSELGRTGRRRLTVVDSAAIDSKRKVVIIRRDNVEHVIMTGGPADLVIESGLPVAEPGPAAPRRQAARPQQPPAAEPVHPVEPDEQAPEPPPPRYRHKVSRDAIDRLRDLARPAPLKPRDPQRYHGLMSADIPTRPQLRVDNSAGPQDDSANTEPVVEVDETDGQQRFVGGTKLLRSIARRPEPR